ncbi:MAG: hypothetical protein NW241_04790 [Bacteroidia bacterium]|nr:hypothetical protein [Bacteroidia bacterium]
MKTWFSRSAWMPALLAALVLTFASGCKPEGCTDANADNFDPDAQVDDGSCVLAREKFIATYNVNEACPSGNFTYSITITASSTGTNGVIVSNFGNFGQPVNGTVNGSSISIPSQTVTASGVAVTVNGTGSINGTILTINYQYNFAGGGESCTMNCSKL